MAIITQEEIAEYKKYYATLNTDQLAWVKHKCNYEQMIPLRICQIYRGHIDSLAPPKPIKKEL